jgi:SAM-dependent methyltransferase
MPEYVLDHHKQGERARLELMSSLLDPMHRRYAEELGIGPGADTLEVGCGNGSMSAWLAQRVAPSGHALAVDLDLSLLDVGASNLEVRRADICAAPVERGRFDLVTARAVLHHVADVDAALENLVAGIRPGGAILLVEPDFLPVMIAEPPAIRTFWQGWLEWSRGRGIDYMIGRKLPAQLTALKLERIEATAETALYRGGSPWARYWQQTIAELRGSLVESGALSESSIEAFSERCADPNWWTQTIAFTAVRGVAPT